MRRHLLVLPFSLALALPMGLTAQSLAVGARAGTLGVGAEAALGLGDRFALRAGFGALPYDHEGEIDGQPYTLSPPGPFTSVGVDIYPFGGGFRLMAGLLRRGGNIEMNSELTGPREIGDREYDTTGLLRAEVLQDQMAPFAGIGFGRHTSGGFGFFLDLGVALVGDSQVEITPSGAVALIPGIAADIAREEAEIEDEIQSYLRYWPILNVGFRFLVAGNR